MTLSDIAKQSGVSVATVSLVMNNRPGISQSTRNRVLEAAESLGYPLKRTQANSRAVRLSTLGMIVKSEPSVPSEANPFYSKVIVGIEEACRHDGINLMFSRLPVDANNRPTEVPAMLNSDVIDGLLMVGTFVDETITWISTKHTPPLVLVDAYSDTESFDAVVSDNFRAAYQAVEYLLSRGHRHIALIGGEACSYPSLRDRRNGYLRALKENEIGDTYVAEFNINQSHGHSETTQLLKEHPLITALFGINDEVAVTAMHAAQELGRVVPQDLSVIGYDDTYLAVKSAPPLTTMHVDIVSMGRAAVQMLNFRLDNPNAARITLTIHPTLIERESIARVK
ncbi:MAG: LacI family transcriptional regulator [Chloroflexi bacterium]|nr:LacI family transcriptional regulator [Chloroflexota bacterium]